MGSLLLRLEAALAKPIHALPPLLSQAPGRVQEEPKWELSRVALYAATRLSDPEQPMLRVIERDVVPQ